ncbi:hypothetical protein A3B02_02155 [Candidatus Roizmanbacteria bacterium RIFCSPLOWO2_01_FULL_42_14]|uniref:HEPN domain-containing protein n=4 Tax=Candidatus Roizmaniibacteriota TaxID=1752723 RepID=A0A1F7K229_9BACT|nr:MAG: hypothetical protein A3D08_02535 [Candidatus Roizmanbacteria bacterium RIFCSPHIGHO2_02_FULL_43_11]OGK37786.1 MAG: hypothetical protein A3F32_01540 [Candidatus Roizmanbacteria bacterium RIFCSPHIGHO2_12_FULL_42_10]OGK51927.1 MAG: hypothetical protein A3B02_02155 [Candidatus Roizmanbacteria bacterium RIFCSPLOWO2_01_FULL_42_14]OGK61940.1 MAG: hypothetical protein A3I56_02325 [Candidatus Roizmanbacteria bacterium RIFCSPLOWO2_02_FULL_43_10]
MKTETKMWLELAREDYKDMQVMAEGKRWRGSVFFAQQAVEKIVKAYIVEYTDKNPLKTHRIEKLIDEAGIDMTEINKPDVRTLSKAYEWTRYADLSYAHFRDKESVKPLLDTAEIVYLWLTKKFKNK